LTRAGGLIPTPREPTGPSQVTGYGIHSFELALYESAAVGVECVERLVDFRLSCARTRNPERISPVCPHDRAAYEAPLVAQLGVATTLFTTFSTNSDVGPINFSEGVAYSRICYLTLRYSAYSYPVARYGEPWGDPIDRLRHPSRVL